MRLCAILQSLILRGCPVALAFVLVAAGRPATAAEKIPNDKCLECHSKTDLDKKDAQGHSISLYVDEAKMTSLGAQGSCLRRAATAT